jgi:hypothetical protein
MIAWLVIISTVIVVRTILDYKKHKIATYSSTLYNNNNISTNTVLVVLYYGR